MPKLRFLLLGVTGLALGLLALTAPVAAQSDYPNRPVRLIIPFPPGGSNDVVGRMIGTQLSEQLGKQVVVDNRAGAGGVVGTEIAVEGAARRLHARRHLDRARGQSVALQAALRPDQGVRAGRHHGHRPERAGGPSRACRSIRCRS